ncbi:SDR family NAD(P)-dependent oxidoreductase, partial [Pseudomonas sp.]|uniref:SDR family NAD(P)-dependent oxidoreductase n=1 Tax=Pseudomonas sp. TaxID=306 RepID=UPI002ED7DE49
MSTPKTLFITGVSSGFGQALAQQALAAGHRVIGTLRNDDAVKAFDAQAPGRAHGVLLDVTEFNAIDRVVVEADTAFGPIDVLVNNAGYGHEGILEESPLEELRRQFDVNVFGAVAIIKAFVP